MKVPNKYIIEDIYDSIIVDKVTPSKEYIALMDDYKTLYDTIEDEELKKKFKTLEEYKAEMGSSIGQQMFKLGYSYAIQMLLEGATTKIW